MVLFDMEEEVAMEVVHVRCAGLDISKRDAKVCVRIAASGRRKTIETVTTWASMTNQILALREHLAVERVTCVVMEATGDYWKPFYYLLEDLPGVEVMLVNARHVKNLPGRKTDVSDATWLAQLRAHGLVRGSFVPPEPIRRLRDLTRARTAITRERGREIQRLEKLLEDAGIKLSAVASDITGVSGRLMLESLIEGQRDPSAPADLAKRRLRSKIPELIEALTSQFSEHHAFLAQVHLDLIDRHSAAIEDITARIQAVIKPFQGFRELITTIPGISVLTADVIIAEIGGDMSRFPTPGHLASWAGTTRAVTSPLDGSNPPGPVQATPTSKEPLAPRQWPVHRTRQPTSAPDTVGSLPGGVRRRQTSRSSTKCSSRYGTRAWTGPSTRTPAAISTPVYSRNGQRAGQSTSSKPWATK
ncbi:transposase [Arthrobacter sp. GAS37]